MSHKRWYCGLKEDKFEVFFTRYDDEVPTIISHPDYTMILDGLKTKRGAIFLNAQANDDLSCNRLVTMSGEDAEKLAKIAEAFEQLPIADDGWETWDFPRPEQERIDAIALRRMMD